MTKIDYPLLHAAVFYETNRMRRLFGLAALRHSEALERAAEEHSRNMVKRNFFSHESPVPRRKHLQDRAAAVGIRSCRLAENIAECSGLDLVPGKPIYPPDVMRNWFSYQYGGEPIPAHTYLSLAEAVVKQWFESEGHRQNMLDSQMNFLGAGAAHFKDFRFYKMDTFRFTQIFSSHDASAARFFSKRKEK